MYLTEIPELSANCMYSAVNVYMIVNQWDATFFIFSDIKALEYDKLVITTSLVGNRSRKYLDHLSKE